MKPPVIYLDMDGVIADFVKPLIKAHGREDLIEAYEAGEYPKTWNMDDELGTEEELWVPVDALGEAFWDDIPPFSWTSKLLSIIKDEKIPWYICTHARHTPGSYSGKVRWIHKHISPTFKNIIMTRHKHLLAHSNALLIDDNEQNTEMFTIHGGNSFLFPQSWNSNAGTSRLVGVYKTLREVFDDNRVRS